jgi:antitoxin (DNA-binding transcriptional repressor) of toxin-antitoxin stability system
MKSVPATELKNRLGEALKWAALEPVAVERHGRVVAYLVPPTYARTPARTGRSRPPAAKRYGRADEERLLELAAGGDFRPSRWARAGDASLLAGLAALLASVPGFDRGRMLGLAERLHPGMSRPEALDHWLATSPVKASRFLPMLAMRMR